ncbi:perforin-like protein 4, putative, partial [Hepatocystis sp. ex Piliocolobus tephrosceles]
KKGAEVINNKKGEDGEKGAKVIKNKKGEDGKKGAEVINNKKGEDGEKGAKVIKNKKGDDGKKGAEVINNKKGEDGKKGAEVISDKKGEDGKKGAEVISDKKGEDGKKGAEVINNKKGEDDKNDENDEKNLEIKCSNGNSLGFGFKIKLGKKDELNKIKIEPCNVGSEKCVMNKKNKNSDFLIWGFCIPSSLNDKMLLELKYTSEQNITRNVRVACTDQHKDKQDNVFFGFSFNFDKELKQINVNSCTMKSKYCLNKIKNNKEKEHIKKHYAGTFLLCRSDGGIKRKFE